LKLYGTLVGPAEKFIPKGSSVVIIPSKFLSLLNFETLIVPGPQPHYWIEDVEVQNASSVALLTKTKTRSATSPKQMLALGAPVEASKDFPVLKHASEEIGLVRRHFASDQETVVSGSDATSQAYRGSDPGIYRYIHL